MQERTNLSREERVAAERADFDVRDGAGETRNEAGDAADTGAVRGTVRDTPRRGSDAVSDADVDLLGADALTDFRTRWERLQVRFVDEPREAVQSAHDLVGEVVDRLSQSFTKQREGLEGSWTRGEDDTEALRRALQRYRSFFNRLLST